MDLYLESGFVMDKMDNPEVTLDIQQLSLQPIELPTKIILPNHHGLFSGCWIWTWSTNQHLQDLKSNWNALTYSLGFQAKYQWQYFSLNSGLNIAFSHNHSVNDCSEINFYG